MFSIFNRKKRVSGLDWLAIDMHNHLLPRIDDGAPDCNTSILLIKGLQDLGIKKTIATPHVFQELYPNNHNTIKQAYQNLQSHDPIRSSFIQGFAAEYMLDENFGKHLESPLLTLKDNYVLIEMSYLYESPQLDEYLFQLQLKNYQPILAHPERYLFFQEKISRIQELKDKGVLLQLNLLSLSGYYGAGEKKMAHELVKKGLIDFVGTDIHHERHLAALQKLSASGIAYDLLGEAPLKNHLFLA